MTVPDQNQLFCPDCGRSFIWNPELAGHKAECSCGHVMPLPDSPPKSNEQSEVAVDTDPIDEDSLSEINADAKSKEQDS